LYSLKSWERRSATSFVVITASSVGIKNVFRFKKIRTKKLRCFSKMKN
jgi:hypothetical protein